MRVSFVAAECEPWAKTGGLGDVVDALARALGRIPGGPETPVDVYLPRYRSVTVPEERVVRRRTQANAKREAGFRARAAGRRRCRALRPIRHRFVESIIHRAFASSRLPTLRLPP